MVNKKQFSHSKHVNERVLIAKNVFMFSVLHVLHDCMFENGQYNGCQLSYCNMKMKQSTFEVRQVNIMVLYCYIIHLPKPIKQHIYDQKYCIDCCLKKKIEIIMLQYNELMTIKANDIKLCKIF